MMRRCPVTNRFLPKNRPPLSTDELERLYAAYLEGRTAESISLELGIHRETVAKWIDRIDRVLPVAPPPVSKRIFLSDIAAHTAHAFGMPESVIRGRCKTSKICRARFAFCYLAFEVADQSLSAIGRYLGRDHSSIGHACDRCVAIMAEDEGYRAKVEAIRESVLNSAPLPSEPTSAPEPTPEPVTVTDGPECGADLPDDDMELLSLEVSRYIAAGGDFVEVY